MDRININVEKNQVKNWKGGKQLITRENVLAMQKKSLEKDNVAKK